MASIERKDKNKEFSRQFSKTSSFYALRRIAKSSGQKHVESEKLIENKIKFLISKIEQKDIDLDKYAKFILEILVTVRADLTLPLLATIAHYKGEDYFEKLFNAEYRKGHELKNRLKHIEKVNDIVELLNIKRIRKLANVAIMLKTEKQMLSDS